jgi:hypothetical protein
MQPQPPYGPPPYGTGGYYPPPPKQGNGFATAGFVLAILFAPVGLIFSVIGLVKAKARAGAGRGLSIAGIIVSAILMTAGLVSGIAFMNSPATDPGCISAESAAVRQGMSTVVADSAAMDRDSNNVASERTDVQRLVNDMKAVQGQLTAAEGQAQHQAVKAELAAVISDMNAFSSSLQAITQGDTSQVSQLGTAASKMETDGNAVDSTCSTL